MRVPYYINLNGSYVKHPWHYLWFHHYQWYRRFTTYEFGWQWELHEFDGGEIKSWHRMKDV